MKKKKRNIQGVASVLSPNILLGIQSEARKKRGSESGWNKVRMMIVWIPRLNLFRTMRRLLSNCCL